MKRVWYRFKNWVLMRYFGYVRISDYVDVTINLSPMPREHQWTGCMQGGNHANVESYEWIRYCKVCGMEDTCEDPLPPCLDDDVPDDVTFGSETPQS